MTAYNNAIIYIYILVKSKFKSMEKFFFLKEHNLWKAVECIVKTGIGGYLVLELLTLLGRPNIGRIILVINLHDSQTLFRSESVHDQLSINQLKLSKRPTLKDVLPHSNHTHKKTPIIAPKNCLNLLAVLSVKTLNYK